MDPYNSTTASSIASPSESVLNYTTSATTDEQVYARNESAGTEVPVSLGANFHMKMVYLAIGSLGMIGNILVIVIILYFKELRRRLPNVFILNQSLIDCTAGFFLVVTTLFNDISVIENEFGREMFCRLWLTTLPTWSVLLSSTYNLMSLTVERYLAIVHPFVHSYSFTRKRAYIVMACVWSVGPVYNAAYMIPSSGIVHDTCSVFAVWPNETTQSAVGIVTVVIQYVIPLALIAFCYGRIASVLKSEDITSGTASSGASVRNERVAKGRRNVIKILAIVSAFFVACWSPNQIYFAMYNLNYPVDFNSNFYHFTVISVFLNCCVNPFVYALKYDQFQVALRRLFCGGKRPQRSDPLSPSGTVCHIASSTGDSVMSVSASVAPPVCVTNAPMQHTDVVLTGLGGSNSLSTKM